MPELTFTDRALRRVGSVFFKCYLMMSRSWKWFSNFDDVNEIPFHEEEGLIDPDDVDTEILFYDSDYN